MSGEDQARIVDALRSSLKQVDRLRRENDALRSAASEPVAIVGVGCRYPGGISSRDELWDFSRSGRDGIVPFPRDRGWPANPPWAEAVRIGGFVYEAGDFDPGFFGIGPREALLMDPQQRKWLEVSWEAFEDAGIDPTTLRGSDTGVYVGVIPQGYGDGMVSGEGLDVSEISSGLASVVPGRVAYALGLRGPAVAVDTACSGSLVALHLACQGLRAGDCTMAVAGGVSFIVRSSIFDAYDGATMMSDDGRCRAYSDAATGTAIGEGAGALVLERLSDAHRLGHRVLAVIRGSAINQDGASNGLTAPSGLAQQDVIRQALADAGVAGRDVDLVEGHGTGTSLGDPIEIGALMETYGRDRDGGPLWLGSMKSQIGHSGAAAAAAGVIRMVMAIREGVMPPTLHAEVPTRAVDWDAGTVELVGEPRPWERDEGPRRAGVSGFGLSGTNAHLILEQAPPPPVATDRRTGVFGDAAAERLWIVSGRTPSAVRDQAQRVLEVARGEQRTGAAIGAALATRRASFEHRLAVVGDRDGDALRGLEDVVAGRRPRRVVDGSAAGRDELWRTTFVFPGYGTQWAGMGRELWGSSPVFAARMEECERALAPHVEWSLREVLCGGRADALEDFGALQPALWAVMVGLAEVWRACGIRPAAVVGHSQGELAAAVVAGHLALEDAARIVVARTAFLDELDGAGGVAAIGASTADVERLIARTGSAATIAVHNGPAAVTVSGAREELDPLLAACRDREWRVRDFPSSRPGHGPLVEPLRERMIAAFGDVRPRDGGIEMWSTVTGEVVDPMTLTAEYWFRNVREPVRFADTVGALLADGHRSFVEASPHLLLGRDVQEIAWERAVPPEGLSIIGSLRRDGDDTTEMLEALASAWCRGGRIDWAAVMGDGHGWADLPTYAFQSRNFWLTGGSSGADVRQAGLDAAGHGLLATETELADGDGWILTGRISGTSHPWLGEHRVEGRTVVPASALLELLLRGARSAGHEALADVAIAAPLLLDDEGAALQVRAARGADGSLSIAVSSRSGGGWTRHASAVGTAAAAADDVAGGSWPPAGEDHDVVPRPDGSGTAFGAAFEAIDRVWAQDDVLQFEAGLEGLRTGDRDGYLLHPALLESVIGFASAELGSGRIAVLEGVARFVVARPAARTVRFTVRGVGTSELHVLGHDHDGGLVVEATGVAVRDAPASEVSDPGGTSVLAHGWTTVGRTTEPAAGDVAVVGEGLAGWDGRRFSDAAAVEAAGTARPSMLLVIAEAGSAGTADGLLDAVERGTLGASNVVVVTHGAVAAADGDRIDRPDLATILGRARTLRTRRPGAVRLVDLGGTATVREIVSALQPGEDEVAVRQRDVLAPRLVRVAGATGPALDLGRRPVLAVPELVAGDPLLALLRAATGVQEVLVLVGGQDGDARGSTDAHAPGVVIERCDLRDPAAILEAIGGRDVGAVFEATSDPAVAGALHDATRAFDLARFVSLHRVPNPVDAAHADAVTAGLEALVGHRRGLGLAAGLLVARPDDPPAVLAAGLAGGRAAAWVGGVALSELRARYADGDVPSVLRGLLPRPTTSIAEPGARAELARRFAEVSDDEVAGVALEVVRTETALILGQETPDEVEPRRRFLELGLDSQNAVRLTASIGRTAALTVPPSLLFDHDTPEAVAGALVRLRAGEVVGGVAAEGASDALRAMLERFLSSDSIDAADSIDSGEWAGSPVLEVAADHSWADAAATLSAGPRAPRLVCLTSMLPMSGPHEYAQFARSFRGLRDVVAIPTLGFGSGEPLPATFEVALQAHAVAFAEQMADRPCVLVGHSSGGLFAYALAAHLERLGTPCAGLVLLDTYASFDHAFVVVKDAVADRLRSYDGFVTLTRERLAATGAYASFMTSMDVAPLAAPTLLVRAVEPPPGVDPGTDWRASWVGEHDVEDAPGDHFTMMVEHAGATAGAVERWVSRRIG